MSSKKSPSRGSVDKNRSRFNFRVIAATNQDLETAVGSGEFREDLFWRLNVFAIDIPPLRNRPEDVPLLAKHFLAEYTRSMNRKPMEFSTSALEALKSYSWPGNVRELQNAIERAVVVGKPPKVEAEDFPLRVTGNTTTLPARGTLAEVKKLTFCRCSSPINGTSRNPLKFWK